MCGSIREMAEWMEQISSFSNLFAAIAHAVVLSVCLSASFLFTVLLHPSLSLSVHLASCLPAVSIPQIFFFDVQTDVLLFFHWNR